MQNSGDMVETESMYFSSSKDKNHVLASRAYFGVIEEILEIYFKVPLFKCKWIDNNTSVETDELGFTRVDTRKATYKNEQYIMETQEKQVFYVTDPSNTRWSIILQGKHLLNSTHENQDFNYETPCLATYVRQSSEENDSDDVHVVCRDHEEGIWEN